MNVVSLLAGWKGYASALAIGLALGATGAWWAADRLADRERLAAERAQRTALALINAANEASHAAELADRARALAAVEAAAEAERARAAELQALLERLALLPPEENCALGPVTRELLEELR